MTKVKFLGRSVKNPALKFAAVAFGIITIVMCLPITIPLHTILRVAGRRGIFYREADDTLCYAFDREAFGQRIP